MIRMPWDNATAPSAMIEITDACNISCACCYKKPGNRFRTLAEIERDIEDACRLRPIHTLTISGGEPTLHPDLMAIIGRIKRRGLFAFLLTNGMLVDRDTIGRLKQAGLDAILFHVDAGQQRPDLARARDVNAVKARLAGLARMAASAGMDVSASMTLTEQNQDQLVGIVDFFLGNRDLNFLFLARGIQPESYYRGPNGQADPAHAPGLTLQSLIGRMRQAHGLEPYSFIPARTGQETNWITYFIPIVYHRSGYHLFKSIGSRADLALMLLHRAITGRFTQKTTQNALITLVRTVVNGLATGRPGATLRFVARMLRPGTALRHKMIVYDHGPTWTAGGELSYCEYCATAIVRDGALVPCCLADYRPEGA
ncbi:radical SAM protein [bacterium]|nr:radical SAM protein [bacterium]